MPDTPAPSPAKAAALAPTAPYTHMTYSVPTKTFTVFVGGKIFRSTHDPVSALALLRSASVQR